jgi:hypothetical protein
MSWWWILWELICTRLFLTIILVSMLNVTRAKFAISLSSAAKLSLLKEMKELSFRS